MLRLKRCALVVLAVATIGQSAEAHWLHDFFGTVKRDYHRKNCWPEPFVEPDRAHVWAPFHSMTTNGWRRNNLLGRHHFNSDSTELSTLGKLKVEEILNQQIERRAILVPRNFDSEITAARVDTIQQFATQVLPNGSLPEVQESSLAYEGHSAQHVDTTHVLFRESLPAPQLPAVAAGFEP